MFTMDRNPSSAEPTFEIRSSSPARHTHRRTSQMEPSESRKRRRINTSSASSSISQVENADADDEHVESIDLTEVDGNSALSKVLAKQREDAIAAQKSSENKKGRSILTSYKCPVCLEPPVDATTTSCGHLFCHKCIINALKINEEQRADHTGKTPRGACPVCRKPLSRMDAPGPKRNLVPLQIKLTTRKRSGTTPQTNTS